MPIDQRDTYRISGEHVAVLMSPAWRVLGPALGRALAGMPTDGGPVLDVGAGTGPGTRVIAAALPGAQVLAVEPDQGLRTALLAAVVADPDLCARVTVAPTDLLATQWPTTVSGLVAMNVLGHLDPAQRAETWRRVADRLAPGGRVVVGLAEPHTAVAVPRFAMPEVLVGRRRYGGTAEASVIGDRLLEWRMDYRVAQDGVEVGAAAVRYAWHVVGPDELEAELAAAGLTWRGVSEEGLVTASH